MVILCISYFYILCTMFCLWFFKWVLWIILDIVVFFQLMCGDIVSSHNNYDTCSNAPWQRRCWSGLTIHSSSHFSLCHRISVGVKPPNTLQPSHLPSHFVNNSNRIIVDLTQLKQILKILSSALCDQHCIVLAKVFVRWL